MSIKMKLQINREHLLLPLQKITGVVEKRQTLPILANVLFQAKHNQLIMTATDLEIEMRTYLDIDCSDEFEFTIPALKLLSICKSLPDGSSLNIEEKNDRVNISTGNNRFSLSLLPANDYPSIQSSSSNISFEVQQGILRKLIANTQFAMAQQDVRYYLNGLLLEINNGFIKTVATDGHRLAFSQIKAIENNELKTQLIIPRKAIIELYRLLDESENIIRFEVSSNYIRVHLYRTIFTSKLIDGIFPDYEKVIPKNNENKLVMDKSELKQSLRRASILSNEKYKGIKLEIKEDRVQIIANNPEQEEAKIEIDLDYSGKELNIGLNVTYLLDVLNAITESNITIEFKNKDSSILIYGAENPDNKYVIMPMRI
ncbi:DNA polymerase III, beta subunit [endosymbiont of Ridgeia piscesae]|jgi:DNA polymerase-3 subunit beta|uniref:Beta sliding clamp n=2 Tax=endosymbiont of Ridgeia piscesae TaxID=54398 RepID=A0A0T5YU46_9GAMM|nr:DNA polymerase III, beta subunit [endosymbiont of Ridgeia piscesae]KRT60263.1 DNA polymerase III, beta subunit [endosymbiont of Ridgeia piscesae]